MAYRDRLQQRLEETGRPLRVGLVGAGQMGTGLAAQLRSQREAWHALGVRLALGPSLLGRIVPSEVTAPLIGPSALAPLSGIATLAVTLFAFVTGLAGTFTACTA